MKTERRAWPGRYELRRWVYSEKAKTYLERWFRCEVVQSETARGKLRVYFPPGYPKTSSIEVEEVRARDSVGEARLRVARARIRLAKEAALS